MKIGIIGAGIAGATIAAELVQRGHDVNIFDGNGIAKECSFANGGQLSVCNAEVWNTWANIWKGLKWMVKPSAPLHINPLPTPEKLLWIAGFLRHTNSNAHKKTMETIKLGLLSREVYFERHHIDKNPEYTGYVPSGMLHVYSNDKSLKKAKESANMFNVIKGAEWVKMTPDQILEYDPNMSFYKDLKGGYMTYDDSVIDINRLCNKLIQDSKLTLIEENVKQVTRFTDGIHLFTEEGEYTFDKIVIANGHAARQWGLEFGNFFNLYPIKGYSISVHGNRDSGFPYVALLDDDKKIVSSTFEYENGKCVFRVAGTAEIGSKKLKHNNSTRLNPLYKWSTSNFDLHHHVEFTEWTCARPMMSDMLPFYDRSRIDDRIYYHIGHGHLGLTLAAGTAYILADKITEEKEGSIHYD